MRRAVLLPTVLVAASFLPRPASSQALRAPDTGDGETLLRAIFFLDGPVVGRIPELRRMREAEALRRVEGAVARDIRAFQGQVLADLRRSEPGFLRQFAECMRSGDRRAISKCLGEAGGRVDEIIGRSPSLARSRQRIRTAWKDEPGAHDAGGVERALAVQWPPLTYRWPNLVIAATPAGSDLLRDDLVNSIATRLKAAGR